MKLREEGCSLFRLLQLLVLCVFNLSVLILSEKIRTEDGCPYAFDLGNSGFKYIKPTVCLTLTPDNFYVPPSVVALSPFTITLAYTSEENTFLQDLEQHRQMWNIVVTVYEVKARGKLGPRVGFFEPDPDYESFCCEDSKLRRVFRHRHGDTRFSKVNLRWVPLNFRGKVVFVANIFASETEWWANVTSRFYTIPPPTKSPKMKVHKIRYIIVPDEVSHVGTHV